MRSPFSAPIVLPLQWLVCLKGFVMPVDRIQTNNAAIIHRFGCQYLSASIFQLLDSILDLMVEDGFFSVTTTITLFVLYTDFLKTRMTHTKCI